ncbi:hypothetical protein [Streptomyces abikoensis]|uniref:hypothetical protein n=1 Tax=Streptomyces abikoensis TaxID=97398 RepID=UPI0019B17452|nr:hypothetical protein [Streptomyces abikoensis]GGP34882.1 hypothetical protein GCM10010214_04230 [Streptomyces abikoensis]
MAVLARAEYKPAQLATALRLGLLVPEVADVRAVVVGNQTFCARIMAPPGVLDWRVEYRNLRYEPVDCPTDVRSAVAAFVQDFGLKFGAFDFAVTAAGAWWLLECNPNGQWAWLEEAAGLPITAAMSPVRRSCRGAGSSMTGAAGIAPRGSTPQPLCPGRTRTTPL